MKKGKWSYRLDTMNTISIEDDSGEEMCSLYTGDGEVTPEMRKRAKFIIRCVNYYLENKK